MKIFLLNSQKQLREASGKKMQPASMHLFQLKGLGSLLSSCVNTKANKPTNQAAQRVSNTVMPAHSGNECIQRKKQPRILTRESLPPLSTPFPSFLPQQARTAHSLLLTSLGSQGFFSSSLFFHHLAHGSRCPFPVLRLTQAGRPGTTAPAAHQTPRAGKPEAKHS